MTLFELIFALYLVRKYSLHIDLTLPIFSIVLRFLCNFVIEERENFLLVLLLLILLADY